MVNTLNFWSTYNEKLFCALLLSDQQSPFTPSPIHHHLADVLVRGVNELGYS